MMLRFAACQIAPDQRDWLSTPAHSVRVAQIEPQSVPLDSGTALDLKHSQQWTSFLIVTYRIADHAGAASRVGTDFEVDTGTCSMIVEQSPWMAAGFSLKLVPDWDRRHLKRSL